MNLVIGLISTMFVSAFSGLVASFVTVYLNNKYQKESENNNVKKYKFALYINTKQMKNDIISAKSRLDTNDKLLVSPIATYRGYDYLTALCVLMDELSEVNVDILMRYYDNCLSLDNYKMSLNNNIARRNANINFNPALLNVPDPEYDFAYGLYRDKLNELSSDERYTDKLVLILDKLK